MLLAEMEQEVRETLGVHLSDRIVRGWLRRAHRKVTQAAEWPWHYVDAEITLVQSGGALAATNLPRARRIINVWDTYAGDLPEMSWRTALDRFLTTGGARGTYPSYYSVVENANADPDDSPELRVRLWPVNSEDREGCVLTYLRAVPSWPPLNAHATATPAPIPEEMHDLLVTWALNEANLREGDNAAAAPYYSSFMSDVEMMKDKYVQTSGSDFQVGGADDFPSRRIY